MSEKEERDSRRSIDLFGTVHIDRPGKVQQELSNFVEGSEVIFTEESQRDPQHKVWYTILRNPTVYIGGQVLNLIWGLGGTVLVGFSRAVDGFWHINVDAAVTEQVASEKGLPTVPTDTDKLALVAKTSPIWTILSWFLLAFMLGVASLTLYGVSRGQSIMGGVIIFLLLAGVALAALVAFVYLSLGTRDRAIAKNADEHMEAKGYSEATLVVGRRHLKGIKLQLQDLEDVEVGETHKSRFFRQTEKTS